MVVVLLLVLLVLLLVVLLLGDHTIGGAVDTQHENIYIPSLDFKYFMPKALTPSVRTVLGDAPSLSNMRAASACSDHLKLLTTAKHFRKIDLLAVDSTSSEIMEINENIKLPRAWGPKRLSFVRGVLHFCKATRSGELPVGPT